MVEPIFSNPVSLIDVLRFRVENQEDQRAYIFLQDGESESGFLTYGSLDQRARAIAGWLQTWCPKGERALLIYTDALEFITAFFGCLYAGILAVPVQPPTRSRTSRRISSLAADAQPSVILTTESVSLALEHQRTQTPDLAFLPSQTTERIPMEFASQWRDPEITADALAFLQYTSGSTSVPKGVMVSHGNLMHNLALMQSSWENTTDCVNGTWLPAFHDMGLIEGILQPLYCGYPSYIMPPIAFLQRPLRWLQMITKYKVTNSGGPNSSFDLCVSAIKPHQLETLDLNSWSFCYNGSEPVRKETLDRFFQTFRSCGLQWHSIHPGYGLAEATLLVSGGRRMHEPVFRTVNAAALSRNEIVQAHPEETGTRTLVSSGPIDSNYFDVTIVDPVTLQRCEPEKIGEIWLKSVSVAQGYWNRHLETNETFHAYEVTCGDGPFLRTGDIGFIADGELFITGRLKDIIIVAGRNYYPQDIEQTVEQAHPAIRSNCCAAFSIYENGQERLVIACEINREYLRSIDHQEIMDVISQSVTEEHEIGVRTIHLLRPGSIPKTSSGKIQRQICKTSVLAGELKTLEKV